MSSFPFEQVVSGINLQIICDIIVDFDRKDDLKNLKNKSIIFCKTDFLQHLYNELKDDENSYILVTHMSDYGIGKTAFSLKPKCIKKWFAQNVKYEHPDLIPLPIGLENHKGASKGSMSSWDFLPEKIFKFNNQDKIVDKILCNFNPNTNHTRIGIAELLRNKNLGYFNQSKNYSEYIQDIQDHLFVASPPGNGVDCHRTWETLYLGSIPIVEKHFMFDRYKNLPIIQINKWEDLNEGFLAPYIKKYKEDILFKNTEELTLIYWINRIILEKNRLE
jgi:hypothetical protein